MDGGRRELLRHRRCPDRRTRSLLAVRNRSATSPSRLPLAGRLAVSLPHQEHELQPKQGRGIPLPVHTKPFSHKPPVFSEALGLLRFLPLRRRCVLGCRLLPRISPQNYICREETSDKLGWKQLARRRGRRLPVPAGRSGLPLPARRGLSTANKVKRAAVEGVEVGGVTVVQQDSEETSPQKQMETVSVL